MSDATHISSSETATPEVNNKGSPLWNYVNIIVAAKKGTGENCTFKCKFCNNNYNGSLYRVRCHLLKISGKGVKVCPKISNEKHKEITSLVETYELNKTNSAPRQIPLPTSSSKEVSSSESTFGFDLDEVVIEPKKRKGVSRPLEKVFKNSAREQLDGEIARMFYTGGLSFNLSKNSHYICSFNRARAYPIPGYHPPGYNALRTTLLQKERLNIERMLELIKQSWQHKGVSVCSDGWSDAQRMPLINVMSVCEGGPMFLKAVNCEGESKDKHFIADLLIDSIKEIGPQNIVKVITDNASACKAAGDLVNARFPHIFWTPCVVHTLNLVLKNICKPSTIVAPETVFDACNWITQVADHVWFIKNFIMNHGMRLAMFNEHSNLKMLSVVDTRFASIVVMLKRFKKIKQCLERMVISDQWDAYTGDDVTKARVVKDMILDYDAWSKIDYILDFTSRIYEMLRKSDTDEPCLHKIYEWWDTMIEKIKIAIYRQEGKNHDEHSHLYDVVHGILASRWTKSTSPLHCMAYSLNPRKF